MTDLHVGIVGGTDVPGNVRTFLNNVHDLLVDADVEFQFDLIVRKSAVDDELPFHSVDPGLQKTNRAIETVRSLTTAVKDYAQSARPDVLWQVTKFPVHGFATVIAGKRTGIPVVTRFAGDNFREYRLSENRSDEVRTFLLNNVLGRFPASCSDVTIALGPYGKEQISHRGGSDVRIIPQPVNTDMFHPFSDDQRTDIRTELGLKPEKRTLLTVGRLSYRKGTDDLLDAARELNRRRVDFQWCVVGDGSMRDALEATPNVDTVGRVPYGEMHRYYQAADLVVHPSRIEGLPNVLLEAAACATPSLARDVGDCAVAASETYGSSSRLSELVTRDYEPVSLENVFEPDALGAAYTAALVDAAPRDVDTTT